jgi:hypothetical protein
MEASMADVTEQDDPQPGIEDDPLVVAARQKADALKERVERLKEKAGGDWVENDEETARETGLERPDDA